MNARNQDWYVGAIKLALTKHTTEYTHIGGGGERDGLIFKIIRSR